MGKSPSGEKRTPGRSIPLELNATEDHDATLARRLRTDSSSVRLDHTERQEPACERVSAGFLENSLVRVIDWSEADQGYRAKRRPL